MYNSLEEYKKAVAQALAEMGVEEGEIDHMIKAYESDVVDAYNDGWLPLQVAMPISQNY